MTDEYHGPERRREVHLTQAQIDRIAEAAADKAVAKMIDSGYQAVGRTVVQRGTWIVGLLTMAVLGWATSKGWIKLN